MSKTTRALALLCLLLPGFAGAQQIGPPASNGGNASSATVTATGGTTARTLADIAAQQGVLVDAFKLAGDPDDTASFTRAVAAQVPILCGAKTYFVHDFATGTVSNFVLKGVPACVIMRNSAINPSGTFFAIQSTNVVIDGVTFDMNSGSVSANQWGVRVSNATGGQVVSIKNSVFRNNSGSIGSCWTLSGTGPSAGGSFIFADNEVTNCTLQAVYVNAAINGVISHNWVHDVSGFGIFVSGSTSQPAQDVVVDANRVFRTGNTGISFGGIAAPFVFGSSPAYRLVASNNILQDNPNYAISLECDYCDAVANYISQSSPTFSLIGAIDTLERYGKIENNTIVFSGQTFAIDIGGSQAMLVQGNVVTMDKGSAFNTGGNLNSTIRGNTANLSGTAYGIANYAVEGSGGGLTFPTQSSNNTFENNVFNMTGSSTVGIAVFDDAGGATGASANTIRGNKFNVTGSGISHIQAIQWKGGPHTLVIEGNLWNGSNYNFADPATNPSDITFDWVDLGGIIQGIGSTNNIRGIVPRDVETYGGGGSVLWVMPTNGGSGYTAATTLTFSGTGCTGQVGTAQINNGVIVGVKMTNFGSGCSGAVTVAASDAGGGTGATFSVGTVPVLPDKATIQYASTSTHLLQKSGSNISLLPQTPIQLLGNNGPVTLQALYGGTFWNVVSYFMPTFAVGSLPTCNSTASSARIFVSGSTTSKWEAQCNGTNWIWSDGTVVSG
jgi:hypothetical protein